jgi:hypothetical protein
MLKRFALTNTDGKLTCPELDGYELPELPERQEDDNIDKVADEETNDIKEGCSDYAFKDIYKEFVKSGYRKAREKYEFTREDMIEAFKSGFKITNETFNEEFSDYPYVAEWFTPKLNNFIASLRTARTPIAIEVEMVEGFEDEYNDFSVSMNGLNGIRIGRASRPKLTPDGTVKGRWVYE